MKNERKKLSSGTFHISSTIRQDAYWAIVSNIVSVFFLKKTKNKTASACFNSEGKIA